MLHAELTERQIGIRIPKSVNIRRIRVIRVPFDLMNTISSISMLFSGKTTADAKSSHKEPLFHNNYRMLSW